MTTLKIRDAKGAEAGSLDVSDAIFSVEPNKDAVRQTLLGYLANQRQGTHSTKTRAHVSGGGRKPWKQKGTGRARQGSIRSPQWRGGAIIFGPTPRDYRQKINKKVRRLALASALSDLVSQDKVTIVKSFGFTEPKTKNFTGLLNDLKVEQAQRILILATGEDENLSKSARNLPSVLISDVSNINIYLLLTCDHLIATPEGLQALEKQFNSEEKAA
jgi:large subunit ribosomal protein L4